MDEPKITNAFTVDLEDWYQGIGLAPADWNGYEKRLEGNLHKLLSLFDEHEIKATFFILGYISKESPHLVREVHRLGHRIGSHTYGHEFVYKLTKEKFRADLERALKLTEDLIGEKVKRGIIVTACRGHRGFPTGLTQKAVSSGNSLSQRSRLRGTICPSVEVPIFASFHFP